MTMRYHGGYWYIYKLSHKCGVGKKSGAIERHTHAFYNKWPFSLIKVNTPTKHAGVVDRRYTSVRQGELPTFLGQCVFTVK